MRRHDDQREQDEVLRAQLHEALDALEGVVSTTTNRRSLIEARTVLEKHGRPVPPAFR